MEGGGRPLEANDDARGSSLEAQGPDGRGFFQGPQPVLRAVGGLARTGTGQGPAAGAAGPERLSVLDMLGAVMPQEPD